MVWFSSEGQQARDPGRSDAPVQSPLSRKNSPFLVGGSSFLFHLGLQVIGRGPPTRGSAICFSQKMLTSFKNTLTATPSIN